VLVAGLLTSHLPLASCDQLIPLTQPRPKGISQSGEVNSGMARLFPFLPVCGLRTHGFRIRFPCARQFAGFHARWL